MEILLSVMIFYTCWFLFYFYSFNIGTWHQSKLGMIMCKDTKSSRLLINLVLFFIKKERKKPPCLSFIPLLKCVKACESAGLCRVNLWHHYKQLWMSACIIFGQRCLMGCHSLPRQYYYPTWFPTSPSSALFSFHMLFSTISGFSLSLMTTFLASKRVLFFSYNCILFFSLVLSDTFAVA